MRNGLIVMTVLLAASTTAAAAPAKGEAQRLADAARVMGELRSTPDNGIPAAIWDRARCVAVMPGLKKAAFVVGGEYGRGVVSCRTAQGWSAPVFLTLEKASVGVQLGAQSTDLVLLVMNDDPAAVPLVRSQHRRSSSNLRATGSNQQQRYLSQRVTTALRTLAQL
jgi:lipid-binding SYLF domain-containing protein